MVVFAEEIRQKHPEHGGVHELEPRLGPYDGPRHLGVLSPDFPRVVDVGKPEQERTGVHQHRQRPGQVGKHHQPVDELLGERGKYVVPVPLEGKEVDVDIVDISGDVELQLVEVGKHQPEVESTDGADGLEHANDVSDKRVVVSVTRDEAHQSYQLRHRHWRRQWHENQPHETHHQDALYPVGDDAGVVAISPLDLGQPTEINGTHIQQPGQGSKELFQHGRVGWEGA